MNRRRLLNAAKRRVTQMDKIERMAGFATPHDAGSAGVMRTCVTALDAALSFLAAGDGDKAEECIADSMVMLARASGGEHLLR